MHWSGLRFLLPGMIVAVAAGCSGGPIGPPMLATREAVSCIPTNTTCADRKTPSQLNKLVTPGSCQVDTDCKADFNVDATCVQADDNSGLNICQKGCGTQGAACPHGTYCDTAQGACIFGCDGVSTTGPRACTNPGEQCGCDGRCALPCPTVVETKPVLSTSPLALTLNAPTGSASGAQTVAVTLTAANPVAAAAVTSASIEVVADSGTFVSCSLAGGGMSPMARSGTLSGWVLAGGALTVTRPVSIQLAPVTSQLSQNDYAVRLASAAIANSPYSIGVHRTAPRPASGTLPDGIYGGEAGTRVDVIGATLADGLAVPVQAYVRNGTMVLVDPSYTLAASGRVTLNYGPDHQACQIAGHSAGFPIITCKTVKRGPLNERWFGFNGNGYDVTVMPENSVSQLLEGGPVEVDYTIIFPYPQAKNAAYHATLHPLGPLPACGANGACADGFVCDETNVCAPLQPEQPSHEQFIHLVGQARHLYRRPIG